MIDASFKNSSHPTEMERQRERERERERETETERERQTDRLTEKVFRTDGINFEGLSWALPFPFPFP